MPRYFFNTHVAGDVIPERKLLAIAPFIILPAQGGRIELGGELPVNVHGGQNRFSYMVGWHNTHDAVLQLRNEAMERKRQIKDANTIMVTVSTGHWQSTWSMIYRNEQ